MFCTRIQRSALEMTGGHRHEAERPDRSDDSHWSVYGVRRERASQPPIFLRLVQQHHDRGANRKSRVQGPAHTNRAQAGRRHGLRRRLGTAEPVDQHRRHRPRERSAGVWGARRGDGQSNQELGPDTRAFPRIKGRRESEHRGPGLDTGREQQFQLGAAPEGEPSEMRR